MRPLYFYNTSNIYTHTQQVNVGVIYPNSTELPVPPDLKTPTFILGGWAEYNPIHMKIVPVTLSKIDFMNRFTDTELVSIYTAAKTSVMIEVWIKKLDAAVSVSLSSPSTISGLAALEAAGLLATNRSTEILKGVDNKWPL